MKKFLSLLLALLMVLSLAACAGEPANTTEDPGTPPASENTDTPAEEPAEPTEEPAEAPAPEEPTDSSEFTGVEVSLPLVTEPVTVKYWWPSVSGMASLDLTSAEDYLYFVEMEKRTGVHVEIEVPNDPQTQFGLMMASEEYPDLIEYFTSYYTQGLDHAIDEDLVAPLEDYAEYIPNIMSHIEGNNEIRRHVYTDDGHLPGIPMMYMRRFTPYTASNNWAGYVVRQDWLDELNMEVPTTYSELTDVLAAFKANYSDYIPFQLSSFNGSFMMALGQMFWAGYNFTADWMQIDGEVKYSPISDGYRDYLQLLNSWFEAGYIDPDIMSKMSIWTDATTAVSEQFGVFPVIYTQMGAVVNAAQAEIPSYALTPMAQLVVDENTPSKVCAAADRARVDTVVMADSENIELICQWWDYLFSPEGIILSNYGVEHETFEYNEDGIPQWIPEAFTSDDPVWNLSNMQYKLLLFNAPGYCEQDREFVMVDENSLAMLNFWNEGTSAEWNYPGAATMTASESEDYASIMADITTYVTECTGKLFIGAMSFDEWDSYVANIESMGIEDAIELKQAALDRYNNR